MRAWIKTMIPLAMLAGCSRGSEPAAGNDAAPLSNSAEPVPDVVIPAPAPGAAPATPYPSSSPTPPPTPSPTVAAAPDRGAIPRAFRGRWGLGREDCDPRRDDTKGLVTIDGASLNYWESRARPRSVRALSTNRIETALDWTGEGQEWRTITRLTLSDGGRTLVTDTMGEGVLRYARCPA